MASRLLSRTRSIPLCRGYALSAYAVNPSRTFRTTTRLLDDVQPVPVKKPVGAFRGGFFGFLLGSSLAGAAVYYYILEEYKVSNELLTEDIYALTTQVQRTLGFVQGLDEKVEALEKKRK